MTITKTPLGADTFGGYVNVSKQDINRTSPAILDMIIADLAEQYAIETEEETADVLWAAATAGPVIPTGTSDPGRRRRRRSGRRPGRCSPPPRARAAPLSPCPPTCSA